MKSAFRISLLGATALIVAPLTAPFAAHGQDGEWYVQGFGGANWVDDIGFSFSQSGIGPEPCFDVPVEYSPGNGFCEVEVVTVQQLNHENGNGYGYGSSGTGELSFDVGYVVGAAAGYDFGRFRLEGEVAYRENDVDDVSFSLDRSEPYASRGLISLESHGNGGYGPSVDGDISALTFMANAYYDIETGSRFTPYIGAGIGAGLVDLSYNGRPMGGGGFSGPVIIDDEDWGFAAQGIIGAGYEVADNVEIFVEGRVLGIFDLQFETERTYDNIWSPNGQPAGQTTVNDDYIAYSALAGLRVRFGGAAPPPVEPAPAPEPVVAPQQEFVVFFDWDRAVLTAQANNVLDEVVVVYDANGFARINLAGHTDTSGPASYNVGLSERRGESVRQGLVARGVAPDEIVVRAFGETALLVPTPNGVREPQNRRVEIVLM